MWAHPELWAGSHLPVSIGMALKMVTSALSAPFSVPHVTEIFWTVLGPLSAVTFLCTVPICLNNFYPTVSILVGCDTTSVGDCCLMT